MINVNNLFDQNNNVNFKIDKNNSKLKFYFDLSTVCEEAPCVVAASTTHQVSIQCLQENQLDSFEEKPKEPLTLAYPERACQSDELAKEREEGEASAVSLTLQLQLEDARLKFFAYLEPMAWYSLCCNLQGRIQCPLPAGLSQTKKLIYIFKNKQKERYLIGKTGSSLNRRLSNYLALFNKKGSEERVKKAGRKAFLTDVKQYPESFEVGILYALKPEEDLDTFEKLFIDCKRTMYLLYNDHRGGGGGSAHTDESPSVYAIPKPHTGLYTPEKYYRYKRGEKRDIRPQLTPTFKRKIKERQGMSETQEFAYVIKKEGTNERYIGISVDPERRAREHGYAAERFDPENQQKYEPTLLDGCLHPAMAKSPEKFSIGLLPLQSKENLPAEEWDNYIFCSTIGEVEKYTIYAKQALTSQHGYNCNRGGGGSLSRLATKGAVRELFPK